MRTLKFGEALSEATVQAFEADPRLLLMGEGVDDPKGSFGTTREAFLRFGPERVMDTPLSEAAVTGIAVGAAIAGRPTLLVHLRNEFALLGMDALVNHAAKWRYMFGGGPPVPLTVRCIVGRGWGQAAQHSQSFHGMFAQVPGLKVALPSNAHDAKGLLYGALLDPDPVVLVEHRWLFDKPCPVPEAPYRIPFGRASVVAPGKDLTCVALSYQVGEALLARERLEERGLEMEVIDLRSVRPLDTETVLASVRKTGRLLVTDIGHGFGGVAAEVAALVAERAFDSLRAPIARVTLPDCPTPCSPTLEAAYYPTVETLTTQSLALFPERHGGSLRKPVEMNREFSGPF